MIGDASGMRFLLFLASPENSAAQLSTASYGSSSCGRCGRCGPGRCACEAPRGSSDQSPGTLSVWEDWEDWEDVGSQKSSVKPNTTQ